MHRGAATLCAGSAFKSIPKYARNDRFHLGFVRRFASGNQAAQQQNTTAHLVGEKSSTQLLTKNLGTLLTEQCERLQHKDALRVPHQNLRWTYSELQLWVDAAANGLLINNYKSGQSIATFLGNDTESIALNFGGSKVGIQTVNLPLGTMDDLASALDAVKPKGIALLCTDKVKDEIVELIPELDKARSGLFKSKRFPFLNQVINTHYFNIVEDATFYREFHQPNVVPNEAAKVCKSISPDVAVSSFFDKSSSKLTTFNHTQIANTAYFFGQIVGFNFSERICNLLPLSTLWGQTTMWSAFLNSSFVVLPSSVFEAETALDAIAKESCTAVVATSEQIQALIASQQKAKKQVNFSTWKKVVIVDAEGSQTSAGLLEPLKQLGVREIFTYQDGTVYNSEGKGSKLPEVQAKAAGSKQ